MKPKHIRAAKVAITCVLTLLAVVLFISVLSTVYATTTYVDVTEQIAEQELIQHHAHELADHARVLELDDVVKQAQEVWREAQRKIDGYYILSQYTVYERDLLASIVMQEARYCPVEHQQYVAQVVLNRVADERFPSTISKVVFQSGQYPGISLYRNIDDSCYAAADMALMGLVDMPANVVFQAEFTQGTGTWYVSEVDTGYWQSTTYFCY